MKTNRRKSKAKKYNDFHKNHIFLPYAKGREGKRRKGKKEDGGKDEKRKKEGKIGKKNTFFPFAKRRETLEVSANNVINRVSLY